MGDTVKHLVRVVRDLQLVTEVEIDVPLKAATRADGSPILDAVKGTPVMLVDSDAVRDLAIAAPFDVSKAEAKVRRVEIVDPNAEA